MNRKKKVTANKGCGKTCYRINKFLGKLFAVFIACAFFVCPIYFFVFGINLIKRVIGTLTYDLWNNKHCRQKGEKPSVKVQNIGLIKPKDAKDELGVDEDPVVADEHTRLVEDQIATQKIRVNERNEGGEPIAPSNDV